MYVNFQVMCGNYCNLDSKALAAWGGMYGFNSTRGLLDGWVSLPTAWQRQVLDDSKFMFYVGWHGGI